MHPSAEIHLQYNYGIVAISVAMAIITSFVAYDICLRAAPPAP
jgi:NO-binding membrane sensor protein with MHYT domain